MNLINSTQIKLYIKFQMLQIFNLDLTQYLQSTVSEGCGSTYLAKQEDQEQEDGTKNKLK